MAKRGKPEGNKRQRERDKQRKREAKALRKQQRKQGLLGDEGSDGEPPELDEDGNPIVRPDAAGEGVDSDPEAAEGEGPATPAGEEEPRDLPPA